MDTRNFIENRKRRIIDDYVNVLRNKSEDLSRKIWDEDQVDAFADQYDGKSIPFCYSRIYGPIDYTSASLTEYLLPSKPSPSIRIGREGSFTWVSTAIQPIIQRVVRDKAAPPAPDPIPPSNGDLFAPFADQNGGGIFAGIARGVGDARTTTHLGFDIVLYDRKRGRALHEDRLPCEFFYGSQVANKKLAEPIRLDPNTEIEPRIYITTPGRDQTDNSVAANDATAVTTWWLSIVFKGRLNFEVG